MAFTVVQLANIALARIGVRQQIQSLTDDTSTEALNVNLLYEPTLQAVLTDFPWPFATRYATLALVGTDPNSDYKYSYRMPVDCARAIRLVQDSGRYDQQDLVAFTIAGDTAGPLIYTDLEDAVLQYTAEVTDPTYFPSDFAMAISWRLAMELSLALAVSGAYQQNAAKMYAAHMAMSRARSINEEKRDVTAESEFIRDRS